jgi:RhtB (resistance to homoserine/threonine) family protein
MFGIHSLPLFIVSCIMLNLTPGQDTMYIIGRSLVQGRKAGVLSVMGIMTGVLVHTLLAAFGLSAVLASSAIAFSVVKYAGAAYLIWIGIGYLRSRNRVGASIEAGSFEELQPGGIFRQGVLTNVLNPKVSLFFLSFLPQFVDSGTQLVFIPFFLLGMIFFTTGSIWCLVLVYAATWMTGRLRYRDSLGRILKKTTGALFVGLGIKLAISGMR